MKKILSLLLCTAIILCATVTANANCAHNYIETYYDATCITRAFTGYICEHCGDSYTAYDRLYDSPESCHMVLEGDRNGNTLNVTVSLYNNPGFWANRLTLKYNSNALQVTATEKGEVWGKNADITVNADNVANSYVRYSCQNSELGNNTQDGVVFRVTFEIKDYIDNWGISLSARSMDNINYDHQPVAIDVISTVFLGYGDHSYEYNGVVEEPTYDSEGVVSYCCTYCSHTKTENIPLLERPPVGDVNGDGTLDMKDSLAFKLHIADSTKDNEYNPAMDVNEDGKINAKDLLMVKKIIAGVWEYN